MTDFRRAVVPVGWPDSAVLTTARLRLEPVRVAHADAMLAVLADPALYTFIGGEPPALPDLRKRYAFWQTPASPDGTEGWLNWIVLRAADGAALGTVQATVAHEPGPQPEPSGPEPAVPAAVADVAWVIGTGHQRQGFAVEAAAAMTGWLVEHGVERLRANVAPGHLASERVAARLGLRLTPVVVDGERQWST